MPSPVIVDSSRSPYARLKPVPLNAVRLSDTFWEPRRRLNRTKTLVSQYAHLEESGTLDNFRRVADETLMVPFRGWYFQDSDLYKWLEAASSALVEEPDDSPLHGHITEAIQLIRGAQRPDGYLNTYFARERADQRWTNLRDLHEMYCAGHFLQAAVAHYRATGSEEVLTIALRVADNLDETFGPKESGKIFGTDGHPEIEMGLVELARATGDDRYTQLADFLVDARGRVPTACYDRAKDGPEAKGGRYHQDHVPYNDLVDVTGHAVRMLYLAAGATDLFLQTGDGARWNAILRQWENFTIRRMYVSGGAGARYEGEAFGKDFELPNERAYTETCAAIASVMWNHRLLLTTGDAKYTDLLEWTLYNAILPGLSLDGEHYYYQNPLADDGTHRRQPWFGCACCPPNVARLLAQLPGYFYGISDGAVWAHLYAAGTANLTLPDGRSVSITTRTDYPWNGDIELSVAGEGEIVLNLRLPAWCESGATLTVNGKPATLVINEQNIVPVDLTPGGYAAVPLTLMAEPTTIHLHLPMPVHPVEARPDVTENAGRVALARGPLLYCVEQTDHPGIALREMALSGDLEAVPAPDLLGGVVTLRGEGQIVSEPDWGDRLYRTRQPAAPTTTVATITAVPYYAWANREPGAMQVWLKTG